MIELGDNQQSRARVITRRQPLCAALPVQASGGPILEARKRKLALLPSGRLGALLWAPEEEAGDWAGRSNGQGGRPIAGLL